MPRFGGGGQLAAMLRARQMVAVPSHRRGRLLTGSLTNRQLARMAGDPFLGGLVAGLAKKFIPKAASWLGRATQRTIGGAQRKLLGPGGGAMIPAAVGAGASMLPSVGKKLLVGAGGAALAGGAFEAGRGLIGGGERKRYRRIDPCNARALRRALSRVEQFQKFAKRSGAIAPVRRASRGRKR